jgi:hypothetical protein
MVAILTRIFGIEHLNSRKTLFRKRCAGIATWPFYGVRKIRQRGSCARRAISRWTFAGEVFQNKQAEIIRQ